MKRVLSILMLVVLVTACSRTPLDRLKNYKPEPGKPAMTKEDRNYWIDTARKGTSDFKEAVVFCKGKSMENPICTQINEINYQCEQEKSYVMKGFGGMEERNPPKANCDELWKGAS